jgi:hypothetical protein
MFGFTIAVFGFEIEHPMFGFPIDGFAFEIECPMFGFVSVLK